MIEALIRRMMETRIVKDKDYGGDTLYPEKVRIKTRIVEDTLYHEKFVVAGPWENKDSNDDQKMSSWNLSPVYTMLNFWYDTDKIGTRTI